jgi:uncharacterized LabA/DUF88 family protein
MSSDSGKIALFIDGANLYTAAKALGFGIDYDRLLKEFRRRGTLVRAFFYITIIEDQENPTMTRDDLLVRLFDCLVCALFGATIWALLSL